MSDTAETAVTEAPTSEATPPAPAPDAMKIIEKRCKKHGVAIVTIHPFNARLFVFRGLDTYRDRFKAIFGVDTQMDCILQDGNVGGFFGMEQDMNGSGISVLAIDGEPEYPEEFIWHEALHATFIILDLYGVEFDVANHEIYTYTQGYIVSQIRQALYGRESFR